MFAIISLILNIVAILLGALDPILWVWRRFRKRRGDTHSGDSGAARRETQTDDAFGHVGPWVEYHVMRF